MAFTAANVLARVRPTLIDQDGTRWSDSELFLWMTDAVSTILSARPDVFAVIQTVNLAAGTKQVLPAPAYLFLGALRNVNDDGTPGRAVRIVSREAMDGLNPDWHSATPSKVVRHCIYDSSYLTTFFVYPPNDGTGKLDTSVSQLQPPILESDDTIPLPDNYQVAVVDYVLFRAHMKDSDNPNAPQLASTYLSAFSQFLGITSQSQAAASANQALQPGDKANTAGAT